MYPAQETKLGLCGRLLQDDSEYPFLVEASQIRVKRLGLTNHGFMTGKSLGEGPEAPISIDVINDDCAAWFQGCPGSIQFETNVAFTVQAVVNEKINLAELREQPGKPSPARTLNVCPSIWVAVADCHTDLLPPIPFYGRKVNTPEMTASISPKRLKNKAGGNTVSDAGLDNVVRLQVTSETPDRPDQSGITVIRRPETLRADPDPFCL